MDMDVSSDSDNDSTTSSVEFTLEDPTVETTNEDLYDLFFTCAGLESMTYNDFVPDEFPNYLECQPPDDYPIILDGDFVDQFNRYLYRYYSMDGYRRLFDDSMFETIKFLQFFVEQCWDSFRHVSIHAVVLIMTMILDLEEKLDKDDKENLKDLNILWDKLSLIWKLCNRDVSEEIRKIVYDSMDTWATNHASLLFSSKPRIPNVHLARGLRELNDLKITPLMVLKKLLTKEIDLERQRYLVTQVLDDLIHFINYDDEKIAIHSMEILNFSARKLKLELTGKEFALIFQRCHDTNSTVRKLTADFVFHYLYSSDADEMLSQFVSFHYKNLTKHHKEYIDLFYDRTCRGFTWSVWKNYILNCNFEMIPTVTKLFYFWIKKTFDQDSDDQTSGVDGLNSIDLNVELFTYEIGGENWIDLIQLDTISGQIESKIDIILIGEFFNYQSDCQALLDLLKKLLPLSDNNIDEIRSIFFVLFKLIENHRSRHSTALEEFINAHFDFHFKQFSGFLKSDDFYLGSKLVMELDLLIQYFDIEESQYYWDLSVKNIEDISLNPSDNPISKKIAVTSVLMNLLLKQLLLFKEDSSNNFDVNSLMSKFQIVFDLIKSIVLCKLSEPLTYKVVVMMSHLVEYFGPHMIYHKNDKFKLLAGKCDDRFILKTLTLAVGIFNKCSVKNKGPYSESLDSTCCDVVERILHLFSQRMLEINRFYTEFFSSLKLAKNGSHVEQLVNGFKQYCYNFPPNGITSLSMMIAGHVLTLYRKYRIASRKSTKESLANIQEYVKILMDNKYWGIKNKDDENKCNIYYLVCQMLINAARKTDIDVNLLKCLPVIVSNLDSRKLTDEVVKYLSDHRGMNRRNVIYTTTVNHVLSLLR